MLPPSLVVFFWQKSEDPYPRWWLSPMEVWICNTSRDLTLRYLHLYKSKQYGSKLIKNTKPKIGTDECLLPQKNGQKFIVFQLWGLDEEIGCLRSKTSDYVSFAITQLMTWNKGWNDTNFWLMSFTSSALPHSWSYWIGELMLPITQMLELLEKRQWGN